MTDLVVLDAGPLIAMLSERDEHHSVCAKAFGALAFAPVCCLPVFTEAVYMLRDRPASVRRLFAMIREGSIMLVSQDHSDVLRAGEIMMKYRCDFADACLVILAKRFKTDIVFTLDRRHFRAFGRDVGGPYTIVPDA